MERLQPDSADVLHGGEQQRLSAGLTVEDCSEIGSEDGSVLKEDAIELRDEVDCLRRRDELILAIGRGGATQEQKDEYTRLCGQVREARLARSADYFGPVACKSSREAVA